MDDRIRAQHMLEAARDVAVIAAGRSIEDLRRDMPMRRALINAIQEIGEAAARVTPDGRTKMSGVSWTQMVGMRHRLVRGYDVINLEIVWQVATSEVGPLIAALEAAFVAWPLPESHGA
jgi:uncharacterized protein with HEPN domain